MSDDPREPESSPEARPDDERPHGRFDAIILDDNVIAEEVRELAQEVNDTGSVLRSDTPPSMIELMGGPLGMGETALPTIAFVVATTAGETIKTAAIIAVVLAAVLAIARMARRQTPQFALAGVIGVAISAYIASKTGEARDFFVPGLLINVVYGLGAFGSAAIKHPFVGYVVEGIGGEDMLAWRRDPAKMRAYTLATAIFGLVFVLRVAVQLPLYFANAVVALGTVRLVMGFPLFGLAIWLSWLIISQTRTPAASTGASS